MEARVRLPDLSLLASNPRFFFVGFTSEPAATTSVGAEPANGAYFAATSTNTWKAVVRNKNFAVTDGVVDTGIATSTNFIRMRIELSSSTVYFLIDGNVVAQVKPASMPPTNMAPQVKVAGNDTGLGSALSSTAVAHTFIDVAYIRLWVDDPTDGASVPLNLPGTSTPMVKAPLDLISGADIAQAALVAAPESFIPGMLVSNATSTIAGSTTPMVRKAMGRYDANLSGVVSSAPYAVLGAENEQTVRIAQIGRVPVIVSLENGPIHQGDKITASSIEGIGMKATRSGMVIGSALESFDVATSSPTQSCDPELPGKLADAGISVASSSCVRMILVQLKPGTDLAIGNILQDAVLTPFANLTEALGELTNAAFTQGAEILKLVVGQLVAKVAVIGELFADHITATVIQADTVKAKTLCLDDLCLTKTQLQRILDSAGTSGTTPPPGGSGGSGNGGNTGTTTGSGQASSTDSEAPVITLSGNNPATVNIGDTYTDVGASVTDNVDGNLGFKVSLDGAAAVDLSQIVVDTSTSTQHTLVFSATDNAGNTGTATRIVNVVTP
jgi:hypothetical protein